MRFLKDSKRAYFVFGGGKKVKEIVSQIYSHAVDLCVIKEEQGSVGREEQNKNLDRQSEIKKWMSDTLNNMEPMFGNI